MINDLKDKYFPVLDHGFCSLVDYMGDDHAIARAARCSYGKGTKKVSSDRGLIRTLIREMHTSPLEMCEIVLHVGLPIFVARQWVRHRTASLNEYSGRYSIMPMLFYEPEEDRCLTQSQSNKQGSSDVLVHQDEFESMQYHRQEQYLGSKDLYRECLDADLTREVARIELPLSTYTYWYWKIDLKNLMHFLSLRMDVHAQWEIRQYANVIAGMVKEWLPHVWEAFEDYILHGIHLSLQEMKILRQIMLSGSYLVVDIHRECRDLGMSKRETAGFINKLDLIHKSTEYEQHVDYSLDLDTARSPEFYQDIIQGASV